MRKSIGIRVAVASLMLVALVARDRQTPPQTVPQSGAHEIKMTVKKYEYSPAEIHVKSGEKVRLLITALDRKHGIEIKEFKVKQELEQGKETAVEFTPTKTGTFEFKCSVYCGMGHGKVKGKLIVE